MFTIGVPDRQYRRATQVLGPENANPIEYDAIDQEDGFYVFNFDMDYDSFKDIILLLKNNGITTIGVDTQLTERKIMKLADFYTLGEQLEPSGEENQANRMESADDIIAALEKILIEWERKEYKSDQDRWENYYLDIEELVEDFKENASIDREVPDLQEQKVRKLIRKIIKNEK
jgi:hypothetical protein